MILCIVPIAYVLLKFFNIRPEYVFCVHISRNIDTICTSENSITNDINEMY